MRGVAEAASIHYQQYLRGQISYHELSAQDANLWRECPKLELIEMLKSNPYRPGAEAFVNWFSLRGYDTLAISSGLDVFNTVTCAELCINCHISNKLRFGPDDKCLGSVEICVTETNKGEILQAFLNSSAVHYDRVIAIGDGNGDIPMFEVADVSLAYMPTSNSVRRAAKFFAETHKDAIEIFDKHFEELPFSPARPGRQINTAIIAPD